MIKQKCHMKTRKHKKEKEMADTEMSMQPQKM